MSISPIQHVFVLMLENRSFDHMLGFSGIQGKDAESGLPTGINGLTGAETNESAGRTYSVSRPADFVMPVDPAHEFPDVLEQLCGPGAVYAPGSDYPTIVNSGFAASYAKSAPGDDPGRVLRCFGPDQLPVLNALASEFVVFDNWYASMPGPTWPNRLFLHAGSSNGLDHSPTTAEVVLWETLAGFSFTNGTIFDLMNRHNVRWRIYAGDAFPMVAAVQGIQLTLARPFSEFERDVAAADYGVAYTFIEPSYNVLNDYRGSTSQHPLDDAARGEALMRTIYQAIRNSPLWDSSLLVITWDEHGGFYDHAVPPLAAAPGDDQAGSDHNQFGFTFGRFGGRVPAVAVSPWIGRNLVDHRIYDHTSILATLESLFGMPALTARDASANNLTTLLTLAEPRGDAPLQLPAPADSGVSEWPFDFAVSAAPGVTAPVPVARPNDSVNEGNTAGILQAALRSDLALSPASARSRVLARFSAIRTRAQAMRYVAEIREKVAAARSSTNAAAS